MKSDRIKRLFKISICRLFHKKETRVFDFGHYDLFLSNIGLYKGCRKCDLWLFIGDSPKGKAACCSVHAGGDEECKD